MIIETAKFKKNLTTILPGIQTDKVSIDGADLVIFLNKKMLSYNGKVAVSIPMDIGDVEAFGVKAKDLCNLVAKLKEEELDIEVDVTENKLKVKSGKLKATLIMQDISVISKPLGKLKFGEESVLPENFVDATKLVTIADNQTVFKGFAVGKIDGRTVLVSTDKVRISICELTSDMQQCLINDDLVNQATTFGNPVTYSIVGPWFHFGYSDGMHFSILRSDDSSFPFEKMGGAVKRATSLDAEATFSFPAEIEEVVGRVTTLGALDSNAKLVCDIRVDKNKMTVIAQKTTGFAEEDIDWKTPLNIEEPVEVRLPVKTLLAIAGKSSECKIVKMSETCKAMVVSNNAYSMIASCSK